MKESKTIVTFTCDQCEKKIDKIKETTETKYPPPFYPYDNGWVFLKSFNMQILSE